MRRSLTRSAALVLGAAVLLASGAASAHIKIYPAESNLGAEQTYTMRVPNERKVPTTRIEGTFPKEVKVIGLEPKDGWKIESKKDATGAIVGAVWTGSLAAEAVAEFGIKAVNPGAGESLMWDFTQFYDGGETVRWNGPPKTKTPAPVTMLKAAH